MSSQHSGGALVVQKPNRRTFLQTTAGTLAFGWNAIPAATQASTTAADKAPALPPNHPPPVLASNECKKPLRLGLIFAIGRDPGADGDWDRWRPARAPFGWAERRVLYPRQLC